MLKIAGNRLIADNIKLKENEKISSVADHSFYGGMSKYRPVR